jgi:hypothetical protein
MPTTKMRPDNFVQNIAWSVSDPTKTFQFSGNVAMVLFGTLAYIRSHLILFITMFQLDNTYLRHLKVILYQNGTCGLVK